MTGYSFVTLLIGYNHVKQLKSKLSGMRNAAKLKWINYTINGRCLIVATYNHEDIIHDTITSLFQCMNQLINLFIIKLRK